MMKKILLVLFSLSFTAMSAYAEPSVQKLIAGVSITFPAAPHTSVATDKTSYLYQTDSCAYLVQTKPYKDEGKVHDNGTLMAFYDGVAKGILRAVKGTLMNKDSIDIAGIRGLQIEYVHTDQASDPATVCSRVLLVNGQVLIYSFTSSADRYARMKKLREQFLSSIAFDKGTPPAQYNTNVKADDKPAAANTGSAKSDTTAAASHVPVAFLDSHVGAVIKMFALLILSSAIIYFFATWSRRKG